MDTASQSISLMPKYPFIVLMCLSLTAYSAQPKQHLLLKSGTYTFKHKFSEQPDAGSSPLVVKIKGNQIAVYNREGSGVFPKGLIEKGTLMFHQKSQAWIISTSAEDINAEEVGGCSDGPTMVDLLNKTYWSC